LTIPLGTHQVRIVESALGGEISSQDQVEPEVDAAEAMSKCSPAPPISATAGNGNRHLLVALAAIVAIVVCVEKIAWPIHFGQAHAMSSSRELPFFWKRFMDNGRSTRIVLSAPVFFAWGASGRNQFLVARDLSVNKLEQLKKSPQLAHIKSQRGQPLEWPAYLTASDAFASLHLTRFLDSYGMQSSVSSSVALPDEIVEQENVVLFGTANSLVAYEADRHPMTFELKPGDYILDKSKPDGSAIEYPMMAEPGSRVIFPGLIALLPHGNSGGRILVVQGTQTSALILYLTSDSGMQELTQAADRSHSTFFEAVILTEGTSTTFIESRMVAFRSVNADLHASIR
jgi:hypothetical protein